MANKILTIDLSQIEARVLDTVCGQWDMVEKFANNVDVYCEMATRIYGKPVNKTEHPAERGTGKQAVLSCGFGSGAPKFQATAALGIYGPPQIMSLYEAKEAVDAYREMHPMVVAGWRDCQQFLRNVADYGPTLDGTLLGCTIRGAELVLPSGLSMDFSTLVWDDMLREAFVIQRKPQARVDLTAKLPTTEAERWMWYAKRGYVKYYGGKLTENIIQALATCVYDAAVLRVIDNYGLRPALSSHDEAVYVVPECTAEDYAVGVHAEFTRPIPWLPQCPVAAEYSITDRYTK
jgi:DNA polymerase bacteriophage-type